MILNFLNSYIINLAIVVATILGMYFHSLKYTLENSELSLELLTSSVKIKMSLKNEIYLGIFIGFMSFFISMNRIPIDNIRPVDLRYLLIYFSVYYGSPLTGFIAAITLILSKTGQFWVNNASHIEYINNLVVTLIIFFISFIIYKKKMKPQKAILTCLILILLVRGFFVSFFVFNKLTNESLLHLFLYFLVFSSLFLLTGWLINKAILMSKKIRSYRTASLFDSLTGLYNKEAFYFFSDINKTKEFSLALIDFDNFKQINDNYGHLIGDKVLKDVSHLFTQHVTDSNSVQLFRIGGDEFAVLFKDKSLTSTYFKNIKTDISSLYIQEKFNTDLLSLSIGLINFIPKKDSNSVRTVQSIFNLADEALYEAKRLGKNKIVEKNA